MQMLRRLYAGLHVRLDVSKSEVRFRVVSKALEVMKARVHRMTVCSCWRSLSQVCAAPHAEEADRRPQR